MTDVFIKYYIKMERKGAVSEGELIFFGGWCTVASRSSIFEDNSLMKLEFDFISKLTYQFCRSQIDEFCTA